MATTNKNFDNLKASYLFSEIARRTKKFSEQHPDITLLKLGIGNTTEALPREVVNGLRLGVDKLADVKTYTGYGDDQGDTRLRNAIALWYKKQRISIDPAEVFVSDGAKPDAANIQSIFGTKDIVAVQDPAYPVYVDSNIMAGRKIIYMPCTENTGFIPKVPIQKADLIYLCSPNNPTGAVFTKKQLKEFVDYAKKFKAVIIFDAAYAVFITDPKLPKSIYEIPGAMECAIEIQSFSKFAGFTGVRLGWSIVPMDLVSENSEKGKIHALWNRRQTTMFNGASNIAQEGGLAALSSKGQEECLRLVAYYKKNAEIIRQGLQKLGLTVFGGDNAPYVWVKTPSAISSWGFFDMLLEKTHVVTTPGSGFGPCGEGYIRLSAFGHRENIKKAVESIQKNLLI